MLKFPIGCAKAANDIERKSSRFIVLAKKKGLVARMFSHLCVLLLVLLVEPRVLTSRYFIEKWLEVRIDRERLSQICARFTRLSHGLIDHTRMKIEPSIHGLKLECRHYVRQSPSGLAVTVERPSKCVFAVHVFANCIFFPSKFHCLLMIDVVIRVVIDQHSVVENAIESVELGDKVD